ncbi:protein PELOTA 1 isoform X3 [Carex littledalei]|uniref:Protein PELOTA 1 isoform X3 n=1 Tax=Carex littledalei TaxID=544730 RepID=A0A833QJS8_9POAL|nr:protein PELOTA 1 isoform X3 [Carex littledalei]
MSQFPSTLGDGQIWDNTVDSNEDVNSVKNFRKVLREMASGGRDAERAVDYDKEGSVLRVRGKNLTENEHVKIGQFHTLELELHRPFVISKEIWDSIARDILHQASDPAASADLSVILMQEGLAQLFLIGRRFLIGPAIAGYESVCYNPHQSMHGSVTSFMYQNCVDIICIVTGSDLVPLILNFDSVNKGQTFFLRYPAISSALAPERKFSSPTSFLFPHS